MKKQKETEEKRERRKEIINKEERENTAELRGMKETKKEKAGKMCCVVSDISKVSL